VGQICSFRVWRLTFENPKILEFEFLKIRKFLGFIKRQE